MELLLKESEHARRSERLIDDHINIAVESRETLISQRIAFKAIQVLLLFVNTFLILSVHNFPWGGGPLIVLRNLGRNYFSYVTFCFADKIKRHL